MAHQARDAHHADVNYDDASGAAISEPKNSYDIFLSFRGEDTRYGFTGHLYDTLCRRGFQVFMDDEKLRGGELISPTLLTAIEQSRISIVVFSENYASSTWCLDELVKILQCTNQMNQHILPVFYKVDPSDVRHHRKKYGEAITAHENRFGNDSEKVKKWRSALYEASNLSGFEFNERDTKYEYELINRIAERADHLLPKHLPIDEHIVGLKSRAEEVMSLLDINSTNTVCMVGIHGTGGIGKTTLAKTVYNSIVHQFEAACYLADVRERSNQHNGLNHLQETLLSKLLKDDSIKLRIDDNGFFKIKRRLRDLRVLLVLDDVNNFEQLQGLAKECDWFGPGSRIIITTRDKDLLNAHRVEKRYEMKVLDSHYSLELFCWNAFKEDCPATNYEHLSNRAIDYAKGLPLALKVIGSHLNGKDLDIWESELDEYEESKLHEGIHSVLRKSYDNLHSDAKAIFLDVACFFKGQKLKYVENILDGCRFRSKNGVRELVDKSLISIEGGLLRMHDLTQDMGKDIVRQEAPSNPGKRSRLWFHKDVIDVLIGNSGGSEIEGIILDPPQQEEVEWSGTAFEKMDNLKILIIKNARFSSEPKHLPNSLRLLDWKEYPSECFPRGFYSWKIVVFNLRHSCLKLNEPFKKFECLTAMDFSFCEFITQIPNMSRVPNVRELKFQNCYSLIEVHDSVGNLDKLVTLDVSGCMKLSKFPRKIQMPSLNSLSLDGCVSLGHFPEIMGKMDALTTIEANDTAIEELPHSIGNLTGLSRLLMLSDVWLRELPSSLFMLQNLSWFRFTPSPHIRKSIRKCLGQVSFQFYRKFPKECLTQQRQSAVICCPNLILLTLPNCGLLDADLHLILSCLPNLKMLYLPGNDFVSLPQCIEQLDKLLLLHVSNCQNLRDILEIPSSLQLLDVTNCRKLRDIPEIPTNLKKIKATNCTSLTTESSNRLWSQVLKELHELQITVPETPIPDWFDHNCMGGTMSVSIRGKFPDVALAFTFGKANVKARGVHKPTIDIIFCVNGCTAVAGQICLPHRNDNPTYCLTCMSDDPISEGNTFLWTPRGNLPEEYLQTMDELLGHDWNDVVIQAKCSNSSNLIVNYSGVYVYKSHTNMEDIQFNSLDPNNSTMPSITSEPIKLSGSQADPEVFFRVFLNNPKFKF